MHIDTATPRRSALPALALIALLGACASTDARKSQQSDEGGPDVVTSLVLFPLNVGPNIVVDTGAMALDVVIAPMLGLEPGNLFPIVILMSPIAGPLIGLKDAAAGAPFWDTWAVHEYAQRREYARRLEARDRAEASEASAD